MPKGVYERTEYHQEILRNLPQRFKKGSIPWHKGTKGLIKGYWKDKSMTEETKRKISNANKGKKRTEETKKKIKESNYWRGKKRPPFTDEHRQKMSEAQKGRIISPETRKKMSEATSGEKNWRWIKDRTKLKKDNRRNDPAYHVWRKMVWERDGFKCKINNSDCKGRIEAHHILSWRNYKELRYKVNNGITLCHYHHPRKRVEVEKAIPRFKKLITKIKT